MIVTCPKCGIKYDDTLRTTICFHEAFLANDGQNNFKVHEDAFLQEFPEPKEKQK